jgi:DNA repair photolyase
MGISQWGSVNGDNAKLRELWEPEAVSIQDRFRVIAAARQAGLQTSVMFGPLLPFLSDSQAAIDPLLYLARLEVRRFSPR